MFRKTSIEERNILFLDKLKAGEQVGIDQNGRLYKVKTGEMPEINGAAQETLNNLAFDYLTRSLQNKEFKDITKGPKAFEALIGKLVSTHLLEGQILQTSLILWYNQRFRALENAGYDSDTAEAITTIEMSQDPYLSDEIKDPIRPQPTTGGMSGSYFIRDRNGERIGVFKPMDEEPYMPNNPEKQLRRDYDQKKPGRIHAIRYGATQGGSWKREIVAWEIDRGDFVGIPETVELTVLFPKRQGSPESAMKTGSFQKFVRGKQLSELTNEQIAAIPVSELHKIATFDLAMGNADRHTDNMLYDAETQSLHPIDQGLILLDSIDWKKPEEERWVSESSLWWRTYPQISKEIHSGALHWIKRYDIEYGVEKMRKLGISEGAIREHKIRMLFLKKGAAQGLTFAQLAQLASEPESNSPRKGGTWLDTQIEVTINLMKTHNLDPNDEAQFFQAFAQVLPQAMQNLNFA
ncbi:MAG: hypothetical protein K940chlam9_00822 [Chlamydiae bacterium]|nr:hypothetical protein [Chlamydiota bacterium]